MKKEHVLIIEDDSDIRDVVRILLENEGYSIREAENGRYGIGILDENTDLVILDVMMPGMSGIRTCEEIRKISNVPILFLTAKAQESDRLMGLMAGGDDYLPKPFSYSELLGRVKALIRRYRVYKGKEETGEDAGYIETCGIRIHKEYNEITVNQKEVDLTNIEYHILLLMIQNPGRIFSAQQIYENVWNEPYFYSCNSIIMVHIRKLRVKIEQDPQNPVWIKTVWGRGYKFEPLGR